MDASMRGIMATNFEVRSKISLLLAGIEVYCCF